LRVRPLFLRKSHCSAVFSPARSIGYAAPSHPAFTLAAKPSAAFLHQNLATIAAGRGATGRRARELTLLPDPRYPRLSRCRTFFRRRPRAGAKKGMPDTAKQAAQASLAAEHQIAQGGPCLIPCPATSEYNISTPIKPPVCRPALRIVCQHRWDFAHRKSRVSTSRRRLSANLWAPAQVRPIRCAGDRAVRRWVCDFAGWSMSGPNLERKTSGERPRPDQLNRVGKGLTSQSEARVTPMPFRSGALRTPKSPRATRSRP